MSPWIDSTELESVYNCIYETNSDNKLNYEKLIFAKNKITIWLTRMQNNNEINVNLIATKAILNALIEDNNRDIGFDESPVYSLYALSVIRFCTAITQYSNESNIKSVSRLANRYSCPKWIIDCRHSLCHSAHNQPSIEELRNAAVIALNWLKQFFWLKIIANNNDVNYFQLIGEYINTNEIKVRKKLKNQIIYLIKFSKNELISSLVNHLTDTNSCNYNNKLDIDYQTLKIPKSCLRKFANIFSIINNNNCLSLLLYLLTNKFGSENRSIVHLSLSWFSSVIKAIKSDNKISKFERSFTSISYSSVMPKIEWIRLLYRVSKRPNKYTSTLITLIAPIVNDFVSEEKIQKMIDLSNIFSNHYEYENNEQIEDIDESEQNSNIKSVEDLIESIGGKNQNEISISDKTDWSLISLGSTFTYSPNT